MHVNVRIDNVNQAHQRHLEKRLYGTARVANSSLFEGHAANVQTSGTLRTMYIGDIEIRAFERLPHTRLG